MGHRDFRRVPLDFDWPLDKVWGGYIMPDSLHGEECLACGGTGYSSFARHLKARWYGDAPFSPEENGCEPLTPDTPEVRAFAERNVKDASWYYGIGEAAIVREGERLSKLWNGQWGHHLNQDEVDFLAKRGDLKDFTHKFVKGEGWQRIDPAPEVPYRLVNLWSITGFGHSSALYALTKVKCKEAGVSDTCDRCLGHGSTEKYEGQRAEAEAWEWTEPPEGSGYQLWETTSEGSPQSPVFETPEELAAWCEPNASVFAGMKATYAEWYEMITGNTLDVGSLLIVSGGTADIAHRFKPDE